MPVMGIAERGIGLIHIVVAIGRPHHRGVVDVGQIPLPALAPTADGTVVVGIDRTSIGIAGLVVRVLVVIGYLAEQQFAWLGKGDAVRVGTVGSDGIDRAVGEVDAKGVGKMGGAESDAEGIDVRDIEYLRRLVLGILVDVHLLGAQE